MQFLNKKESPFKVDQSESGISISSILCGLDGISALLTRLILARRALEDGI